MTKESLNDRLLEKERESMIFLCIQTNQTLEEEIPLALEANFSKALNSK